MNRPLVWSDSSGRMYLSRRRDRTSKQVRSCSLIASMMVPPQRTVLPNTVGSIRAGEMSG